MRMGERAIILGMSILLILLPGSGLSAPLEQTEDLNNSVRIDLNDRARYIYTYTYPQVKPTESPAELINTFYQTLARDAEDRGCSERFQGFDHQVSAVAHCGSGMGAHDSSPMSVMRS